MDLELEWITVVGVSGIGTSHAVIRVKHTRENAKTFCTEYEQDQSEECVDRVLRETRLNDQLEGNCESGWFISLYGERLRFIGEAKHRGEVDPKYIILRDRRPLDGTSASGSEAAFLLRVWNRLHCSERSSNY
jgi:hypothetical protein